MPGLLARVESSFYRRLIVRNEQERRSRDATMREYVSGKLRIESFAYRAFNLHGHTDKVIITIATMASILTG